MEELRDIVWTQLFRDKPVPAEALTQMQSDIMAQIEANPVDFQYERELMIRRRWGILLGISVFLAILCLGAVCWFEGEAILKLLDFKYLTGLFANLISFKEEIHFLWQEISLPIIGALCLLVTYKSRWYKESA